MAIRRALLSVYDKTGILELARDLHGRAVELLSTGGTYRALLEAGLPVIEVAAYTGFPEMMDGRVKTLHPKIHGGLLCRRDDPGHLEAAKQHGIGMIDLVVVNLYPFEATCDSSGATLADKIEKIDIGGPSMLRSAAKNHQSVTVLVDPSDYASFRQQLIEHGGDSSASFRAACARKVFRTTARYDALIADELTRVAMAADSEIAASERFPVETAIPLKKVQELRYGENPHQKAALYDIRLPGVASVVRSQQLHGKELSFNNLMDADAAWELVKEFTAPTCAIIKHTNPCGCACADTIEQAFLRAYEGDPQAAFGSIIAVNRELDAATAERICDPGRFVEVIIAPAFTAEALSIITTKPKWKANVRLLSVGMQSAIPANASYVKNMLGGLLVQDYDTRGWDRASCKVVSKRQPNEGEWQDLEFANLVVKHLKSNAICLVKNRELISAGAGQMSRVNSSRIASMLAGAKAAGCVLGSDAFFPFADGVEAAARSGVTAIVQPGGSKGDPEVIAEADRHHLSMVFTGTRHFRH
jgi:phosphoribosylaminoimidazolecarboxamide formyltransferase/IMP cyclohydrolase